MKQTSEGKMLSGFVNKYISERTSFNTEVCSYSFGLNANTTASEFVSGQVDVVGESRIGTSNGVRFPTTNRKSYYADKAIWASNGDETGTGGLVTEARTTMYGQEAPV